MTSQTPFATPVAALTLWFLGAVGLVTATGFTISGFAQSCDNEPISCTVDAALVQSMGLLAMFFAALLIVGGFAIRSKARVREQDRRYQELLDKWENRQLKADEDNKSDS